MAVQWPNSSTFLKDYEGCKEEYFQCGAVELAEKLLDQYLYCHRSGVVVLETEAYPEDDEAIYTWLFCNSSKNPQFKIKGGTTVAWKSVSDYNFPLPGNGVHLYITAGPEDSGDVVHLRSCEPIEGRLLIENRREITHSRSGVSKTNVLVGPTLVSEGLGNEWERNPILYEEGGMQLFYGPVPPHEKLLCGKRLLPPEVHSFLSWTNENYRFALETQDPAYLYYK